MSKCDFKLAINGFKFKISGQGKASFGACYKKLTPSSLKSMRARGTSSLRISFQMRSRL